MYETVDNNRYDITKEDIIDFISNRIRKMEDGKIKIKTNVIDNDVYITIEGIDGLFEFRFGFNILNGYEKVILQKENAKEIEDIHIY